VGTSPSIADFVTQAVTKISKLLSAILDETRQQCVKREVSVIFDKVTPVAGQLLEDIECSGYDWLLITAQNQGSAPGGASAGIQNGAMFGPNAPFITGATFNALAANGGAYATIQEPPSTVTVNFTSGAGSIIRVRVEGVSRSPDKRKLSETN